MTETLIKSTLQTAAHSSGADTTQYALPWSKVLDLAVKDSPTAHKFHVHYICDFQMLLAYGKQTKKTWTDRHTRMLKKSVPAPLHPNGSAVLFSGVPAVWIRQGTILPLLNSCKVGSSIHLPETYMNTVPTCSLQGQISESECLTVCSHAASVKKRQKLYSFHNSGMN